MGCPYGVLDFGWSGPGSSGYSFVFFGKTFYFHSASHQPGVLIEYTSNLILEVKLVSD